MSLYLIKSREGFVKHDYTNFLSPMLETAKGHRQWKCRRGVVNYLQEISNKFDLFHVNDGIEIHMIMSEFL